MIICATAEGGSPRKEALSIVTVPEVRSTSIVRRTRDRQDNDLVTVLQDSDLRSGAIDQRPAAPAPVFNPEQHQAADQRPRGIPLHDSTLAVAATRNIR